VHFVTLPRVLTWTSLITRICEHICFLLLHRHHRSGKHAPKSIVLFTFRDVFLYSSCNPIGISFSLATTVFVTCASSPFLILYDAFFFVYVTRVPLSYLLILYNTHHHYTCMILNLLSTWIISWIIPVITASSWGRSTFLFINICIETYSCCAPIGDIFILYIIRCPPSLCPYYVWLFTVYFHLTK
jgi:hypothetical protein